MHQVLPATSQERRGGDEPGGQGGSGPADDEVGCDPAADRRGLGLGGCHRADLVAGGADVDPSAHALCSELGAVEVPVPHRRLAPSALRRGDGPVVVGRGPPGAGVTVLELGDPGRGRGGGDEPQGAGEGEGGVAPCVVHRVVLQVNGGGRRRSAPVHEAADLTVGAVVGVAARLRGRTLDDRDAGAGRHRVVDHEGRDAESGRRPRQPSLRCRARWSAGR